MATVVNSRTRATGRQGRPYRALSRHNGLAYSLDWDERILDAEATYGSGRGRGGGYVRTAGGPVEPLSSVNAVSEPAAAARPPPAALLKEQRIGTLEPIRESPCDLPLGEWQVASSGSKDPATASLTVFKGNLRKKWAAKMSTITKILDKLQSKMFELFWISILYLNYLYPQISRIVEYVSLDVMFRREFGTLVLTTIL